MLTGDPRLAEVRHLLHEGHHPSDSGYLQFNEDVSIYALRLIHCVQSSPAGLPRGLVCLFYASLRILLMRLIIRKSWLGSGVLTLGKGSKLCLKAGFPPLLRAV